MKQKAEYTRDDDKLKIFGLRLRALRQKKGLSMQELADICNIEYSQISRIERGIINTSLSHIFVIAEALEIEVKELFEQ